MIRCMGCMIEYLDDLSTCPNCGYESGTKPREAYHLSPTTILQGRYIVGRVLGYGGFGVTYIGFDAELERVVAIKEFLPTTFATRTPGDTLLTVYQGQASEQFGEGLKRFVDEAQTLAQFNGIAGIVDIYDTFWENNTAYIIMQFLKGHDVKNILASQGVLDYEMAREIILSICDTLAKVHAKNIIHRDISPDNIYLTDDGEIKLLDFGAARYESAVNSKSLSVILKSGYAPEEQYRSKGEQGTWTDVYALAATFYKMLTGQTPPDSMERAINDEIMEPTKLGVQIPQSVENAILNALNVRRTDRTQTVAEFKEALLSDGVQHIKAKPRKEVTAIPLPTKIILAVSSVFLLALGIFAATGGFSEDAQPITIGGTMLEDNFGEAEAYLSAEENYVIEWTDPIIENYVRAALAKPSGDITANDLYAIHRLEFEEEWTEEAYIDLDLSNLSDFSNLSELTIRNYKVHNLEALSNLTNLTQLELWNTNISDITPLKELTGLKELELSSNQIRDITAIGNLTSLTTLHLRENTITDISPLASLTELDYVNLENNPIIDVSYVDHVPEKELPTNEGLIE